MWQKSHFTWRNYSIKEINMIHTENILERGIIYCIYENTAPFKENDLGKLQQMKDEKRKFICKRAICKCGRPKESKRMTTTLCIACSKSLSRQKHEVQHKVEMDALKQVTSVHGKHNIGNSIWL